jgi:hypothetical protein
MADEDEQAKILRLQQLRNNPLFGERERKSEEAPVIKSTADSNEWLNRSYATIILNGKFRILREKDNGTIEFMDVRDFTTQNKDRKLLIASEGKDPKSTPMTEIWLSSSSRRRYDNGITFDPSRNGHYNGMYNLWKNYQITGVNGDVAPFIDLIKNIICDGHDDNFKFLVALIAQMFQQPHLKPGIAVVIRGDEGVGKSFFIEKLGTLMYPYYFKTSNPAYIFGDHNGQLKDKLMLHLEEAVWAGSKKDESLLKDLITGRTIEINDKFVPVYSVPNHLHLFISGNPEWLVSAGFKARRIFALHASEAHIRDTGYFSKLNDWFNNGGAGALIYYFMNYKCDVDLRIVPVTEELIVQKQKSMPPVAEWIYSIVDSKEMPYGELVDGKVRVIKSILYNDYSHSSSGKRHQMSEKSFGHQFADLLPETKSDNIKIKDSRDIRRNGYEIPNLEDCRRMLETNLGGKIKWSNNDDAGWICLKGNNDFDFSLYKPG